MKTRFIADNLHRKVLKMQGEYSREIKYYSTLNFSNPFFIEIYGKKILAKSILNNLIFTNDNIYRTISVNNLMPLEILNLYNEMKEKNFYYTKYKFIDGFKTTTYHNMYGKEIDKPNIEIE